MISCQQVYNCPNINNSSRNKTSHILISSNQTQLPTHRTLLPTYTQPTPKQQNVSCRYAPSTTIQYYNNVTKLP